MQRCDKTKTLGSAPAICVQQLRNIFVCATPSRGRLHTLHTLVDTVVCLSACVVKIWLLFVGIWVPRGMTTLITPPTDKRQGQGVRGKGQKVQAGKGGRQHNS